MKSTLFKIKHNRFVRLILKPFMEIKFLIQEKRYRQTIYPHKIFDLQGKFSGQRCFVIGNGPSLLPKDLEKIKNEYSFAANRIYNIYTKTDWRPTFFVSTDMDIIRQERDKISKLNHEYMFINYDARRMFNKASAPIIYIYLKGAFELVRNHFVQNGVSKDVSKYVTKTQSVTCVSLELAMYMGFTEIYLLGVDHNYSKYVGKDGKMVEDKNVRSYFEGMMGGDSQAILYVDDTTACYEQVQKYAIENGIRIINLTRGGKLEVFKREKLENVLW